MFNKRGAATNLIVDSSNLAGEKGSRIDLQHRRTAACFLAAEKGDSAKLRAACERPDLSRDDAWAAAEKAGAKVLTAKDGEGFEAQEDMAACMAVKRLQNGGEDWRMSDPHITQVSVRATSECSCQYGALPQSLQGFPQGTWATGDQLPPGCRRAKVDGADYPQLTLCEVSASDLGDLELNLEVTDNLQKFCNERFGRDIVLTAPLRNVEKPGTCKSEGAFCAAFSKTAK